MLISSAVCDPRAVSRSRRLRTGGILLLAALVGAALLGACSSGRSGGTAAVGSTLDAAATSDAVAPRPGPRYPLRGAGASGVRTRAGDDWSVPSWVRPVARSGFFSESADPTADVFIHSVDVSWRQLAPTEGGPLSTTTAGSAQGMDFASLDDQLAVRGFFWMRVFASGVAWAPAWVRTRCGVTPIGPDYDGQKHLPLWNACVWRSLMHTYRQLFVDSGLAADPRLQFVYMPGGFTWDEYDYDVMNQAHRAGLVHKKQYLRWYDHMVHGLVDLFGAYSYKLVFTGEDYPWGPFGRAEDLLATKAVHAGMGIRTGIPEESNFHLSETPAYGSRILPNGHLAMNDRLPVHDGKRVVATENECYDDCGYRAKDLGYAITASNLKSLQLRTNFLYVVPGPSAMDLFPEHWDWVRLELGQQAESSPDAWAALRTAQDTFWSQPHSPFVRGGRVWRHRPWVRNLERWLVQVDVHPDGVARRSTVDVHRHELSRENGIAYEGLATDRLRGQRALYFRLDDRFDAQGDVLVKVTWYDHGGGSWRLQSKGWRSPVVRRSGRPRWVTTTLRVPATSLHDGLRGRTDFAVRLVSGPDLDVRFVRVVRLSPPA